MGAPRQNRVTPRGTIEAIALRGRWMGNRGCLHEGTTVVRPWRSRAWITCETDFRDRYVDQWVPGRYTVLFFHDEAVALAAGHRPCAECRRPAFRAFLDAWEVAHGERPRAEDLDLRLHADRVDGRVQRTHVRPWRSLPDGVFVDVDGPALVLDGHVVPWTEAGYGRSIQRPVEGTATVLTPAATVEVIAATYRPQLAIG